MLRNQVKECVASFAQSSIPSPAIDEAPMTLIARVTTLLELIARAERGRVLHPHLLTSERLAIAFVLNRLD